MRKELDAQLCKNYPQIFKNRNKSMRETCMCWGFECGDGWYWLIDNLCRSITNHISQKRNHVAHCIRWNRKLQHAINENKVPEFALETFKVYGEPYKTRHIAEFVENPKKHFYGVDDHYPWKVIAVQVKEKFGSLRFYYSGGDDEISGMVVLAERMSDTICEHCGVTGATQNNEGWISTLCDTCRKK